MASFASLSEAAARRSLIYWLLARCFSEAPSPSLLGELGMAFGSVDRTEPLAEQAEALGNAARTALDASTDPNVLAIEYTRLFGGISESYGAPPPFESIAQGGAWGGDTVLALTAAYAAAGIEPPIQQAEAPDHLAVELRFLSIACYRESEAWGKDDTQSASNAVRHQRDFLDGHLLNWMSDYCRSTDAMAHTPFYHALLALAPRACTLDREDIDTILASVPPVGA